MTPLEKANAYVSEIADISHDDLFDTEFHTLALHDERNRLTTENARLREDIAELQSSRDRTMELNRKQEAEAARLRDVLNELVRVQTENACTWNSSPIMDKIRAALDPLVAKAHVGLREFNAKEAQP